MPARRGQIYDRIIEDGLAEPLLNGEMLQQEVAERFGCTVASVSAAVVALREDKKQEESNLQDGKTWPCFMRLDGGIHRVGPEQVYNLAQVKAGMTEHGMTVMPVCKRCVEAVRDAAERKCRERGCHGGRLAPDPEAECGCGCHDDEWAARATRRHVEHASDFLIGTVIEQPGVWHRYTKSREGLEWLREQGCEVAGMRVRWPGNSDGAAEAVA